MSGKINFGESTVPAVLQKGTMVIVDNVVYIGGENNEPIPNFNQAPKALYDYIVVKEGNNYSSYNHRGEKFFSSNNFSQVMQSSIDAIPSQKNEPFVGDSGGSIAMYCPTNEIDNIFVVTETIYINKRISVNGLGNPKRNPIIYLEDGANCDVFLIEGDDSEDGNNSMPSINGVRIYGNRANQTVPCNGISIGNDVNQYQIKDLEVSSFSGYGIHINTNGRGGGSFNSIKDCFFAFNDLGSVYITSNKGSVQDIIISGNNFSRSSQDDIGNIIIDRVVGNFFWTGAIISNNVLTGNAVQIKGGAKNINISNNVWRVSQGEYFVKFEDLASKTDVRSAIKNNLGTSASGKKYIVIGENNDNIEIFDNQFDCTFSEVAEINPVGTDNVIVRHKGSKGEQYDEYLLMLKNDGTGELELEMFSEHDAPTLTKISEPQFDLEFDRDIRGCHITNTSVNNDASFNTIIFISARESGTNKISVIGYNTSGTVKIRVASPIYMSIKIPKVVEV